MSTELEELENLIARLEVNESDISIKEKVYLRAMRVAREQLLKKPVTWARRIKPSKGMGFSEKWSSSAGYIREDDPKPDEDDNGYYEYKPLYDK